MTNKEAIAILENLKAQGETFFSQRLALDLAIEALEKDKCSSCKHYDKDYGETCLNPEGTCRVFEYDGYEEEE
jgi:hypothetical protein